MSGARAAWYQSRWTIRLLLAFLALYLAQVHGTRYGEEISAVLDQLEAMPRPHTIAIRGAAEDFAADGLAPHCAAHSF